MTTSEIKECKKVQKSQSTAGTPSATALNHSVSMMVTKKSNHVSTVLLYGIPIVSLYIEGQERLCLAQISNTLLKAYSYNEIHNRRVALGITCGWYRACEYDMQKSDAITRAYFHKLVQCTPVQLEILRRAGAMPVSSRRCGMITRREAERLCKSFLGDNSPPRLPEDFAFNVQHKCAWGCRGAFLPSRYNSSRAKCIKCTFCGMFFSPNKFIFHSHRMTASDKYIQPDAANFNSWRRHMFLSGQPLEEVVHAWEDVKAMFNGGTRKRLLHSNGETTTRFNGSGGQSVSAGDTRTRNTTKDESIVVPIKRNRKTNGFEHDSMEEESLCSISATKDPSPIQSTVVVPQRFQHIQTHDQTSSFGVPSALQISGFAPQLMVDYMFQSQQHQTQQQQQQQQQQTQKIHKNGITCAPFPFQNCNPTIPWLKSPANSSPFKCIQGATNGSSPTSSFFSQHNYSVPNILNSSAFKPVLQQHLQRAKCNTLDTVAAAAAAAASFVSSSAYTACESNTNTTAPSSPSINSIQSRSNTSLAFASFSPRSRMLFPSSFAQTVTVFPTLSTVKTTNQQQQQYSDDDENAEVHKLEIGTNNGDDDEIEVDIETTEDDDLRLEEIQRGSKINPLFNGIPNEDINEICNRNTEPKSVLASLYKGQHFNDICTSPQTQVTGRQQARSSSRSRPCSCSSSNDSFYMSTHTKSEKECNSRPTSTNSVEINNDTKTSQSTCSPAWKEIANQMEGHLNPHDDPNFSRTQDVISNMVISELPVKALKCTAIETIEIDGNKQPTTKGTTIPPNLDAAINTKSKSHILTNISNQNKNCSTYNHEFWQVASLCLHRPQLGQNLNHVCYNRQYHANSLHQELKE